MQRNFSAIAVVVLSILGLASAAPLPGQTSPAWIQLSPTPDPTYGAPGVRLAHTAVYNPTTNRMIVFGGQAGPSGGLLNDVWVLSNADGTGGTPAWIKLNASGGPGARMLHQAVYDAANNRMIV